MQGDREPNVKKDQPIVAIMSEVAKGVVDTVYSVAGKIWPKPSAQTTVKPNAIFNDVTVDIDTIIVYDEPIEDDYIEVKLASQVQTMRRKRLPSLAEDIGVKPLTSLSMMIPESPKKLDKGQGKERPCI